MLHIPGIGKWREIAVKYWNLLLFSVVTEKTKALTKSEASLKKVTKDRDELEVAIDKFREDLGKAEALKKELKHQVCLPIVMFCYLTTSPCIIFSTLYFICPPFSLKTHGFVLVWNCYWLFVALGDPYSTDLGCRRSNFHMGYNQANNVWTYFTHSFPYLFCNLIPRGNFISLLSEQRIYLLASRVPHSKRI